MAWKKPLFAALLFLAAFVPLSACFAGVTVITHGYGGDVTGWITAMADQIPVYFHARYPGFNTNLTTYTVTLTTDGNNNFFYQWTRNSGTAPSNNATGEIIVKLDWSQMAGLTAPYDITTSNVAAVASYVLLQTNAIADLGGHALAELPLHLIGHSRGGSLISQISYILGTNGAWVDHLTTIDPHPLNNDGNNDFPVSTIDAPAKFTYANVLYADNYWENLGRAIPTDLDPHGEPVAGAYKRQLTSLNGGYDAEEFDFFDDYEFHSNTHLWYYGTMNLGTPASYNDDGTAVTLDSSMRSSWWIPYETNGATAGFYYSLIGGGDRLSADHPLGLPSNPAIVDGFNQWWDLGAGTSSNRTVLASNNGAWPNLIRLNLIGTNTVTFGQTISAGLYYQYGGPASNVTVQFYFDGDFNAYGTNSVPATQISLTNTGVNSVFFTALNVATTNVPPGAYAVYAKISDGTHSRYLYMPQFVQILPNTAPVLGFSKVSGQEVITVTGGSNQKIILQSSADLHLWQPIATNLNSSGNWLYPLPSGPGPQFFRVATGP